MNKLLNGFNNGRDTSEGIGGKSFQEINGNLSIKTKQMSKHTKQFKNWVEELLTEEEGQEIAVNGLEYLEMLYEQCTGKKAKK